MRAIETILTTHKTKVPEHLEGQVAPLPIYTDGYASFSVWELTEKEIEDLMKTKKLYLIVHGPPQNHPIVGLTTLNPLTKQI